MKTIALQLHCSPGEAFRIIELLDQLREAIGVEYEGDIRRLFADEELIDTDQLALPFDDPIDF